MKIMAFMVVRNKEDCLPRSMTRAFSNDTVTIVMIDSPSAAEKRTSNFMAGDYEKISTYVMHRT